MRQKPTFEALKPTTAKSRIAENFEPTNDGSGPEADLVNMGGKGHLPDYDRHPYNEPKQTLGAFDLSSRGCPLRALNPVPIAAEQHLDD